MKATLQEITALLPDFEDMVKLTDEVGALTFQKLILEKEVGRMESNAVREATTNPNYFINGKPASMTYIISTYKFEGVTGEILPLRDDLARVESELDRIKLRLNVYRDMLKMFSTISANERGSGS